MNDTPESTVTRGDHFPSDRSELIDLLDQEIAYRSDRRVRTGWTTRAVVVAITGVLWLLLALLDGGDLSAVQIAKYSIGVLFVILGFRDAYRLLRMVEPTTHDFMRFGSARTKTPTVADVVYNIVIYLIAAGAIIFSAQSTPLWLNVLGMMLLLWFIGLDIGTKWFAEWLGVIPRRVSLGEQHPILFGFIVIFVLAVAQVIVGGAYLVSGDEIGAGFIWDELRVALLIVALAGLVKILVRTLSGDRLLEVLRRIRRRLSVGDLGQAEAAKRTHKAVLGFRGVELLDAEEQELEGIIKQIEECRRHIEAAEDIDGEVEAVMEAGEEGTDAVLGRIDRGIARARRWGTCVDQVENWKHVKYRSAVKATFGILLGADDVGELAEAYQRIADGVSNCADLVQSQRSRVNRVLENLRAIKDKTKLG